MKRTRPEFNGDKAYFTSNNIAEWLIAEEQRGMYRQNVVNMILPVSGRGSAKLIPMPNSAYLD